MSFAMPPLRRALALSAAATLVAAAAFAMTTAAPSAHAESGRRLCMYVNAVRTDDQKTTHRYVVVDYKKDGECPRINHDKYPYLNFYANPVRKLTCEEVSADVEYESKYYGDLCELLDDDIVYGLVKHDGKPLHATEDVVNYGKVSNFH